jgi:hypothetical protein
MPSTSTKKAIVFGVDMSQPMALFITLVLNRWSIRARRSSSAARPRRRSTPSGG